MLIRDVMHHLNDTVQHHMGLQTTRSMFSQ